MEIYNIFIKLYFWSMSVMKSHRVTFNKNILDTSGKNLLILFHVRLTVRNFLPYTGGTMSFEYYFSIWD